MIRWLSALESPGFPPPLIPVYGYDFLSAPRASLHIYSTASAPAETQAHPLIIYFIKAHIHAYTPPDFYSLPETANNISDAKVNIIPTKRPPTFVGGFNFQLRHVDSIRFVWP
jgi:hypothetical protein